jgi:hypothetical protein
MIAPCILCGLEDLFYEFVLRCYANMVRYFQIPVINAIGDYRLNGVSLSIQYVVLVIMRVLNVADRLQSLDISCKGLWTDDG